MFKNSDNLVKKAMA